MSEYLSRPSPEMDPRTFEQLGFLQELNRTFLHPLGLSMSIIETHRGPINSEGFAAYVDYRFEVIDERNDPLGAWYEEGFVTPEKVELVRQEFMRHFHHRLPLFNGSHIQPVPGYDPQELPALPESLVPDLDRRFADDRYPQEVIVNTTTKTIATSSTTPNDS